ncbi:MAG: F0F1 ATP synthase subunit B', partial [Alphaproteobacteria bacterium]
MPQLDSATFPSQLVWLAITFVALYLVMWRVALPRVAEVLEGRRRRIDDNLERAGTLKDEAKAVLAAYEKTLAEARAHAQASLAAAGAELAAAAQGSHGELASRLAREVK